jgi:hypothetical protein
MSWVALLGTKRSDEETATLRTRLVQEYGLGDMPFTCDQCPARNTCDFAFDLYNTDGDCLAEK